MRDVEEKLAGRVARTLAGEIQQQGWPVGQHLGTEAALLKRLGVSREPFREAIRILERQGLVRTGRGAKGGIVIQAPALTAVSNMVRTYLEFADVSFQEIGEVHYALYRYGFQRAAQRMTPAHANGLRRTIVRPAQGFRSRDQEGLALTAVYQHIVDIASNPCLSMLAFTMARITADFGHQERYPAKRWEEVSTRVWGLAAHMGESIASRRLEDALADLDAVFRYVDDTVQSLERSRGRIWNTRSFLGGSYRSAVLAQQGADKVAVTLAYHIMAHVRRNALAPGSILGSEGQLMKQFGVGRNTFREAVRTLEFFGMVTTQRGAGGGLAVTEPNPAMTIETAVLYLRYFGLDARDMEDFSRQLEQVLGGLASRRASHQELLDLLRDFRPLLEAAAPGGSRSAGLALLRRWSRLADNRVLALIVEIVTTVQMETEPARSDSVNPRSYAEIANAVAGLENALQGPTEQALADALAGLGGALRGMLVCGTWPAGLATPAGNLRP